MHIGALVSDSGAYQRWILARGSTNNKQGGPPREGTGISLPWLDAGILKGMNSTLPMRWNVVHTYIFPILTCKWNENCREEIYGSSMALNTL